MDYRKMMTMEPGKRSWPDAYVWSTAKSDLAPHEELSSQSGLRIDLTKYWSAKTLPGPARSLIIDLGTITPWRAFDHPGHSIL
jgi:hypothetical protein